MSWNYRIMRHTYPNGENWYALHEVYYDKDGKIEMYSEDAIYPHGKDEEEVRGDLKRMKGACDKPTLSYSKEIISQKL